MFKSILILLIILGSLSSCRKEDVFPDIKLPSTPLLSMTSRWGVITSTHLRMREKPDITSRPVTTLWQGYVLEIISRNPGKRTVDNEEGYWYQVTYGGLQGWVFSTYLNFYDTREAAERDSRTLGK